MTRPLAFQPQALSTVPQLQPKLSDSPDDKALGAYYTPRPVVRWLVDWAVRGSAEARLLDPSCGDGRFLDGMTQATGIDVSAEALGRAAARLPKAHLVNEDFFDWAATTTQRFDAAVGNPPFIRYQRFKGEAREKALALSRSHGVPLSGLASSWAPFLVGALSLLSQGGRGAFVVPAEIAYAVYARPLLRFLVESFGLVELTAIKRKLFPDLSEDCWLLRVADRGAKSDGVHFRKVESFSDLASPPSAELASRSWLEANDFRLRPLLLSSTLRGEYEELLARGGAARLGSVAKLGIGYVTGDNEFFHLRPSEAKAWGIPRDLLRPSVRSNRHLAEGDISKSVVARWIKADAPMLLLHLPPNIDPPASVRKYLDSAEGVRARERYKCRNRSPWYAVPDVRTPDVFLGIMSSGAPQLVPNSAGCVCTNSVHAVVLTNGIQPSDLASRWRSPLTQLSCEIEGHALGGGMLKLEPVQARRVAIPFEKFDGHAFHEGINELRSWRHR